MAAAIFIPFGLSKGAQISETFSNTTMEHPLMADLKAKGNQVYQQSALGILGQGNDAINIAKNIFEENYTSAIITAGKSLFQSVSKNGLLGEAGMIMSGEGKFQLPNIWEDSDYSRTYSISFENRSPYGHRLSIFENTMVQTLFLIGMTAPRQIGSSTYMSPFYIRAFSKGLFSVEVGLIDKLDITKGTDKNERTVQGFSRVINCELSIKDVVPRLMVGLNAGIFGILSSKNVGFREYLAMFANVDMLDRTLIINKYRVFVNALVNKFSGENLKNDFMYSLSQTLPFKLILKARTNFFGYEPPQMKSYVKPQSIYS
jgi:hypothetical protein